MSSYASFRRDVGCQVTFSNLAASAEGWMYYGLEKIETAH